MNYEVSLIPEKLVPLTWPDVETFVRNAVDYARGRDTWEQVLGRLIAGHSQLWIAFRTDGDKDTRVICGAVISSVKDYGTKRVLRVEYCGGEAIEEWVHDILALMEKFATNNDLDAMELIGRFGWKKMMEKEGWEGFSIIMEKSLTKAA